MTRAFCTALILVAVPAMAQIRIERGFSVGQTVPDRGQYVSSFALSDGSITNITDVNVTLNLSSPTAGNSMWLGDLYVSLTHGTAFEDERVAVLLNRPGRNNTDQWGSDLTSLAITLDDSVVAPNVYNITSATGVYRADGRIGVDPYGSPVAYNSQQITAGLSALDGAWLDSDRWSLLVADTEEYAVARLDSWRLTITGFGAATGTLDPGVGGTISDAGNSNNTVGATVVVSGTGANAVTTSVSNNLILDGGLQGSGEMIKQGGGTLALGGQSTNFTGTVRVNEGVVDVTSGNAIGSGSMVLAGTNTKLRVSGGVQFSAPLEIATNGVRFDGSGILAGAVSGSGGVTKVGNDTMTLAASNSFTGGTVISNGAVRLANSGAAGLGGVIVAQGARLELSNAIRITNTIDATGQISFVSSGNVLAGVITNNNTVYNVNAGTTNEVSAYITGAGGLELIGGGVLEVTGPTNDYQSATTISNGTLRVNTLADAGTASSIGVDNSIVLAGSTAASAILQYTNTSDVAMNRDITLTNNGGGTIDVTQSAATVTLTGSMANAGGTTNTFIKAGAGEIVLSNGSTANNFAATSIQVNAGALTLGAANQIANGTDLILDGGTFRTGNALAGYAESLGDLTLNASSTIDLGAASGLRDLVFVDSSGVAWSGGATLTVANWAGTLSGGTAGRIFFGSSASGLGSGQLSQIAFSGYSAGAQLLGTGELVPLNLTAAVPEPGTYAAAAILLALAIWHHRRRMRSQAAST
jgi:autotransporter-associated beta strand protein